MIKEKVSSEILTEKHLEYISSIVSSVKLSVWLTTDIIWDELAEWAAKGKTTRETKTECDRWKTFIEEADIQYQEVANHNKERDNLNPLEEAEHFQGCQKRFKMTVRKIGKRYHLSHAEIVRNLSLLVLPEQIQEYFGTTSYQIFSKNHAYELTKLCKPDKLKKLFQDNALFLEDWEAQYHFFPPLFIPNSVKHFT